MLLNMFSSDWSRSCGVSNWAVICQFISPVHVFCTKETCTDFNIQTLMNLLRISRMQSIAHILLLSSRKQHFKNGKNIVIPTSLLDYKLHFVFWIWEPFCMMIQCQTVKIFILNRLCINVEHVFNFNVGNISRRCYHTQHENKRVTNMDPTTKSQRLLLPKPSRTKTRAGRNVDQHWNSPAINGCQ